MTSAEALLLQDASVLVVQFHADTLKFMEIIGDSTAVLGLSSEAAAGYTLVDFLTARDALALRERVEVLRTQDERRGKLVVRFQALNGATARWMSVDLLELVSPGLFVRALLVRCDDEVNFAQALLQGSMARDAADENVAGEANAEQSASSREDMAEFIGEEELKCCCSGKPLFECRYCTSHDSPMCLGSGSFAKVYRACWLGTTVAVKHYHHPNPERREWVRRAFTTELSFFRSMRHPNMIRFFGASPQQQLLVIEVAEGGCLSDYIQLSSAREFANSVWPDHLRIATEITCGLMYMHIRNMAHGDIKSYNILMTRDGVAKISDFGTAVSLGGGSSGENTPLSCAWSAPERLRGSRLTSASDVYSLGVVLWELCNLSLPYSDFSGGVNELKKAVLEGERPGGFNIQQQQEIQREDYLNGFLVPWLMDSLIRRSWDEIPSKRPNSEEVYRILCNVKAHWKCGGCGWLNAPEEHVCERCDPFVREHILGTIYSTEASEREGKQTTIAVSNLSLVPRGAHDGVNEMECFICGAVNSLTAMKCQQCDRPLNIQRDVRRTSGNANSQLVEDLIAPLQHQEEQVASASRMQQLAEAYTANPAVFDTWYCEVCDWANHMALPECEQCHAPVVQSLNLARLNG